VLSSRTVSDSIDQQQQLELERVMPKHGDVLGRRYRISRVVGQGGFAVVYECTDLTSGDLVAVKVLKPKTCADVDVLGRFKQEVMLVRQLTHHNTIRILATGTTHTGLMYMVLEFAYGVTLDYLVQRERLSPERISNILEQVLGSLGEAHTKGIVHRDLKPENVMIGHRQGHDDFVKVLDFGIGKALAPELQHVHTRTGMVFCTPRYAAPEILTGRGVSPAADVYAISLIAIELYGGRPLFRDEPEAAIVAFQIAPTSVSIPPEISGTPLGEVVRKGSQKDARARYADAGEMLQALQGLGAQRTLTNTPPARPVYPSAPAGSGAYAAPPATTPVGAYPPFEPGVDATQPVSGAQIAAVSGSMRAQSADQPLVVPPYQTDHHAATVVRSAALPPGLAESPTLTPTSNPTVVSQTIPAVPQHSGGASASRALLAMLLLLILTAGGVYLAFTLAGGGTDGPGAGEGAAQPVAPEPGPGAVGGPTALVAPPVAPPRQPERPDVSARSLLEARLATATWQPGDWLDEVDFEEQSGAGATTERRDPTITAAEAHAERLALLYESAQASEEALALLGGAFAQPSLGDAERADAGRELVRLTGVLASAMIDLGDCAAARQRVERARSDALAARLDASVLDGLDLVSDQVAACDLRQATAEAELWSSRDYLVHVTRADDLCESAQAMPRSSDAEVAAYRGTVFRCVHHRRQAASLLTAALGRGDIPAARQPGAQRELIQLNERISASLLALDLTVAAEVELASFLRHAEILPADDVGSLRALVEQIRTEILVPLVAALGGALPTAFDWAQYRAVAENGTALYEQAQAVETAVAEPPAPAAAAFSARLVLTSRPSNVRVYRGEELVGRTPLEIVLESDEPVVSLSLRKSDYETERVEVRLDGGPVERAVRLTEESRHPFGQTRTIDD
jgi:serine/threonine protein kinase